MKRLVFFLCFILLLAHTAFSAQDERALKRQLKEMQSEKRVALLIGNSNYASSPLKNPVNDTKLMAKTLKSFGFTVSEITDSNQKEMKRAIRSFGDQIRNGGVGLFYYAGHGIQTGGHNYMVPVGADIQSEFDVDLEAIRVDRVIAEMERANNRLNIIILDACRNNPFSRSFRSADKGLAFMNAPSGTFIAYATAPGSVASDGDNQNGLYTEELVKAMGNKGWKIEDVFKTVRANVQKRTDNQQVPWESVSITGDFFFHLPETLGVTATAPATTPAAPSSTAETVFWDTIKDEKDPELFTAYLQQYPNGTYASLATIYQKRYSKQGTTVTQTAKRSIDLPVLFQDNFNDSTNNWRTDNSEKNYIALFNGSYVMEHYTDNLCAASSITSVQLPYAFTLTTDATWVSGITNHAYGVLLGINNDSFITFGINKNGNAVIWLNVDTKPKPEIYSWKSQAAYKQDGSNLMQVEVKGKMIAYSINGELVHTFKSPFSESFDRIGFRSCGAQKTSFDNVMVYNGVTQNYTYAPGTVLFSENFDDKPSTWSVSSQPEFEKFFTDGAYAITTKNDKCTAQLSAIADSLPDKFTITADVHRTDGTANHGFGLAIGPETSNIVTFSLSSTGWVAVWLNKETKAAPDIKSWYKPEFPFEGTGKNTVTVQVDGKNMTFLLNNNLVHTFENPFYGRNMQVGFRVCGEQTATIDNLTITSR